MSVFASFLSHPVVFGTSEAEVLTTALAFLALGGIARLLYQHWRRHECHVRHCHRIQWKVVAGTDHIVCKRHHPHDEPSADQVLADHRAANL